MSYVAQSRELSLAGWCGGPPDTLGWTLPFLRTPTLQGGQKLLRFVHWKIALFHHIPSEARRRCARPKEAAA
eukprot:15426438-Alexandrium_andersonii.AAC.1